MLTKFATTCCVYLGWVLIDRSGKYFGTVLDYLRDGEVPIPNTYNECVQLLAEARYYLVTELEQAVLKRLEQLKEANLSICKVPIITSPAELHQVMDTTGRVRGSVFSWSNHTDTPGYAKREVGEWRKHVEMLVLVHTHASDTDALLPTRQDLSINGVCAHNVMESKIQWKPFSLATRG